MQISSPSPSNDIRSCNSLNFSLLEYLYPFGTLYALYTEPKNRIRLPAICPLKRSKYPNIERLKQMRAMKRYN